MTFVCEESVHRADVWMVDEAVDLYLFDELVHQFLVRLQDFLADYFHGHHPACEFMSK